jgi:hypothetical protein
MENDPADLVDNTQSDVEAAIEMVQKLGALYSDERL